MARRLAYFLLGGGIGLSTRLALLLALRSSHDWLDGMMNIGSLSMAISCGALTVWIAERKKKVVSREELNRPLDLFPRK